MLLRVVLCTRNTSVEEYYKYDNDSNGYYLNSFENILVSGGKYLLFLLSFLPRDASAECGNATVSRPSVCLSVRPSVCDV